MNRARSYTWLFWGVAMLGLALDQTTKYGIFAHLYNEGRGGEIEVIPSAFKLLAQYTPQKETGDGFTSRLRTVSGETLPCVNRGALFGMGGGRNTLFAVVSVAAALAIIYWSSRPLTRTDGYLCLALGLILAGTLGNLYDRLVFSGVRDFFYWYYAVDWPVFNVADVCLVCGAALLLVQAFFTHPHVEYQDSAAPGSTEPVRLAQGAEVLEAK